jgi:hypothetical protein
MVILRTALPVLQLARARLAAGWTITGEADLKELMAAASCHEVTS